MINGLIMSVSYISAQHQEPNWECSTPCLKSEGR